MKERAQAFVQALAAGSAGGGQAVSPRVRRALRWVCLAALAAVIAHRLIDFAGARFAATADIRTSVVAPLDAFAYALDLARMHGRLYLAFPTGLVHPTVWQNGLPLGPWYDLVSQGALIVSSLLAAYAIARYWSRAAAWLYVLIFWALLPQLWGHTPPATGGAAVFLPLATALLAVIALWHHGNSDRRLWLVAALVCFALSLASYETFLLLSGGLLGGALWHVQGIRSWPEARTARIISWTKRLVVLYLFAYVVWRVGHQPQFQGPLLALTRIGDLGASFWRSLVQGVVVTHALEGYRIDYSDAVTGLEHRLVDIERASALLRQTNALDWLAALLSGGLAAGLCWVGRARLARLPWAHMLLAGAWVAATSALLESLSSQYPHWIGFGMQARLGGRLAYFGLVLVGMSLLAALLRIACRSARLGIPVLAALVGLCVGVGSLSASGLNHAVARTLRIQAAKWNAVALLSKCAPLEKQLDGRTVLAPRMWDHVKDGALPKPDSETTYWSAYNRLHTGLGARWARSLDDEGAEQPVQFDYRLSASGDVLALVVLSAPAVDGASELRLVTTSPGTVTLEVPYPATLEESQQVAACGAMMSVWRVEGPLALADLYFEHSTQPLLAMGSQQAGTPYHLSGAVGPVLGFQAGGDGIPYVRTGWSAPEPWGVWTDGSQADLRLRVEHPPPGEVVLRAQVQGFAPTGVTEQVVTVHANGHRIARWRFVPGGGLLNYQATMPESVLAGRSQLHLVFKIEHPISPFDADMGTDNRQLGLGLVSLQLTAASGHAELVGGPVVRFDTSGTGVAYMDRGWSVSEPWGTWTDGPRASLHFRVPDSQGTELAFRVRAQAFTSAGDQSITVLANERPVARWNFSPGEGAKDLRLVLPAGALGESGALRLAFEISRPTSPSSLGISDDQRRLGLGLIALERAPNAGALPELPLRRPVAFNDRGEAMPYMGLGWSTPEPWGTWTEGTRAELRLRIAEPPDGDLVLVADAQAFVPRSPPRQVVTVEVNGEAVARWVFLPGQSRRTVEAPVPQRLIAKSGSLLIVFRIDHPTAPRTVGGGADARELGLGLISLRLVPRSSINRF